MERNEYLDICKGMGIVFVVLGHIVTIPYFHELVYGFHMPLFFMLSGMCLHLKKDFKTFFVKRVKSLLLPFFYFSFLEILFLIIVKRNFSISFVYPEIGHVLWFLPVLFLSLLLAYAGLKCLKLWVLPFLVVLNILNFKNLPYSLSVIPVSATFIVGGYMFDKISTFIKNKVGHKLVLLFLMISYIWMVLIFDVSIDMKKSIFSPFPWAMIASSLGFISIFSMSNSVRESIFKQLWIWLGRNSLTIMLTHFFYIEIIGYILSKLCLSANFCMVLLSVFVWPYLVAVVWFINKYSPWLVSKR